jgi:hypothetical protein
MIAWFVVIALVVVSVLTILLGFRSEIKNADACKNCWLYKMDFAGRDSAGRPKSERKG